MREQVNEPLAAHTTMRVGGPASRFVEVTTTDELVDAVREVDDAQEPLLVLGGGSNLLVSDDGFDGTVVKVATRGVHVESADACSGATVRVAAGEVWDDFVTTAVEREWAGIEALSGIPGSVGATPVQNVGAYGQEVAQTIASVRTWDRQEARVRTFSASDCGFSYRHSLFKGSSWRGAGRFVVLEVVFQLRLASLSAPIAYADLARQLGGDLGDRVPLRQAREAVLAQRALRGMVLDAPDHDTWSCGSFFTNPLLSHDEFEALAGRVHSELGVARDGIPHWAEPDARVKVSAAWLIDKSGFGKGFGLPGPASLSTKHTLAVTNRGSATARDVLEVAAQVRDGVQARLGVRLVNEPVLIGLTL